MAHLNPQYSDIQDQISNADSVYTVDISSLNNSGVTGQVFLTLTGDELSVTVIAEGTAPGQIHPQHIHGLFDASGAPADSNAPTSFDDADGDGFVEVLEGVGAYGDVILALVAPPGSVPEGRPESDAAGDLFFTQTYDLSDASQLFSPVTGADYDAEDLLPLILREYVLHGVNIPDGAGEGTDGEVNGEGGYVPILPAGAGGIEAISAEAALGLLQGFEDSFRNVITDDESANIVGSLEDDAVFAGDGGVRVAGRDGDDAITGGDGDDRLLGGDGDDVILGGAGADRAFGGEGDDTYVVNGFQEDYRIAENGGVLVVQEFGTDNRDVLQDIEAIEFYDGVVDISPDSGSGSEAATNVVSDLDELVMPETSADDGALVF